MNVHITICAACWRSLDTDREVLGTLLLILQSRLLQVCTAASRLGSLHTQLLKAVLTQTLPSNTAGQTFGIPAAPHMPSQAKGGVICCHVSKYEIQTYLYSFKPLRQLPIASLPSCSSCDAIRSLPGSLLLCTEAIMRHAVQLKCRPAWKPAGQ